MVSWSKTPLVLPIFPAEIFNVTPKIAVIAAWAAGSPTSAVHIGEASASPSIVAIGSEAFI